MKKSIKKVLALLLMLCMALSLLPAAALAYGTSDPVSLNAGFTDGSNSVTGGSITFYSDAECTTKITSASEGATVYAIAALPTGYQYADGTQLSDVATASFSYARQKKITPIEGAAYWTDMAAASGSVEVSQAASIQAAQTSKAFYFTVPSSASYNSLTNRTTASKSVSLLLKVTVSLTAVETDMQIAHGTVAVNPDSTLPGSTVTVTVSPDSGYSMTSLTVKEIEVTISGETEKAVNVFDATSAETTQNGITKTSATTFTYKQPAIGQYSYVTAAFDNTKYAITYDKSASGLVKYGTTSKAAAYSSNNAEQAIIGETVNVGLETPEGYVVKSLKVVKTGEPGTVVSYDQVFAMPAFPVTVTDVQIEPAPTDFTELTGNAGKTLYSGRYYLKADRTFDGSLTGNGLKVNAGAKVYIYLNGYTLTAKGKNASGDVGGYAGILLPGDAQLIFVGNGTVNVTGGNAGNGGAGGDGTAYVKCSIGKAVAESRGGAGGAGGAGAGAGIGTNGSNVGDTTVAAAAGGTVKFYGDVSYTVKGGTAGTQGTAGKRILGTVRKTGGFLGMGKEEVPNPDGKLVCNTGNHLFGEDPEILGCEFNWCCYAAGNSYGMAWPGQPGGAGGKGGAGADFGAGGSNGTKGADGEADNWLEVHWYDTGIYPEDMVTGYYISGSNAIGIPYSWDCSTGSETRASCYLKNGSLSGGASGTAGSTGASVSVIKYDLVDINAELTSETDATGTTDFAAASTTAQIASGAADTSVYENVTVNAYFVKSTASTKTIDKYNTTDWDVVVIKQSKADGAFETTNRGTDNVVMVSDDADSDVECGENLYKITYTPGGKTLSSEFTLLSSDYTIDGVAQTSAANYVAKGDAAAFNAVEATARYQYNFKIHDITSTMTENAVWDDASDKVTSADALWTFSDNPGHAYAVCYTPFNAFTDKDMNDNMSGTYANGENWLIGKAGATDADHFTEFNKYTDNNYDDLAKIDIRNAGKYVIYERVTNWYFNKTELAYHAYYTYNTYTFVVEQIPMVIDRAKDSVTLDGTMARNHIFNAYIQGVNGEQVYGEYAFCSDARCDDNDIICSGENWNNRDSKYVGTRNTRIDGINWEFNVFDNYDIDKKDCGAALGDDGRRDMNNYICQNDGTSVTAFKDTGKTAGGIEIDGVTYKAEQNTYYSGNNGVLVYAKDGTVANSQVDVKWTAHYEKDQASLSSDNAKTAAASLDTKEIVNGESITSVFAEDFGMSAVVTNAGDYSMGWPVKVGDAVTGELGLGAKIVDKDSLPEGFRTEAFYNAIITGNKYNGDLYVVTVADANGNVVKSWTYNDVSASNDSAFLFNEAVKNEVYDALKAGTYMVTLKYLGLYYSTESSIESLDADWNGEEELAWGSDTTTFTLVVEPRQVAVKTLTDLDKVYDDTDLLVKDTMTNGDVTAASAYVIDIADHGAAEYQFNKNAKTALWNYLEPEDYGESYNTDLDLEIAGTYADDSTGTEKAVTLSKVRLNSTVDAPNYSLAATGFSAGNKGDIFSAQMYVTHNAFGTIVEHNMTPMRDVLGIHAKAYLPAGRTMSYVVSENPEDPDANEGFLGTTVSFTPTELVEKNDVTFTEGVYPAANAAEYDYDVTYTMIINQFSDKIINHASVPGYTAHESGLLVNSETGEILPENVALSASNSTDAKKFPSVTVLFKEFANYIIVEQTENELTAQYPETPYGQCAASGKNGPRDITSYNAYYAVNADATVVYAAADNTAETMTHVMRYRVVANNNSYDFLLPVNETSAHDADNFYPAEDGATAFVNGEEKYEYVTIVENEDDITFTVSVPQQYVLDDLVLLAIPANPTVDDDAAKMPAYSDLVAAAKGETVEGVLNLGSFATGTKDTTKNRVNLTDNTFYLALESIGAVEGGTDGTSLTDRTAIYGVEFPTRDSLYEVNSYTFTLSTGESKNTGTRYNIVAIPVYTETFDKNLLDDSYKANVTVAKKYVDSAKDELNYVGDTDRQTLFVNYKTAFKTSDNGSVVLSYTKGGITYTLENTAVTGAKTGEYTSFAIGSKEDNDFFNNLTAGTTVTVTLNVWRNGAKADKQTYDESDYDAFDTTTFTWSVSQEDMSFLQEAPNPITSTGTTDVTVDTIADRAEDGVWIDLSESDDCESAILPNSLFDTIKGYAADVTDSGALKVTLPEAQITFNKNALESVLDQAGTNDLVIHTEIKEIADTNPAQQDAFGKLTKPAELIVELTVTAGGETISNFDGVVTVSIPFIGASGKDYTVFYMDDAGNTKDMKAGYTSTLLTFTTSHFSIYYAAEKTTSSYTRTSGGGGGGGGAATYTVSCGTGVSANKASASYGTVVKLTVADGYENPVVTDADGKNITVSNGAFIMPDAQVTVTVTAKPQEEEKDPEQKKLSFVDVAEKDYFYNAVLWAAEKGITSGADETHFDPNGITNRAQMVTFLWRAAGSPEPTTTTCRFTDVKADAYYYNAVLWAVEKGITSGTSDTTFSPDEDVTRSQAVTFLWRYEGSIQFANMTAAGPAPSPFTDVATDAYYYNAVLWAKAQGITSGTTETTFAPDDSCTRAQVVSFLYRDIVK